MNFQQNYNQHNPAVKRIMREACELEKATEEYFARPLEDNIFEWHFTVHGSPGTEYHGGVYHGRILLPPDYPMKPPNIILLTPNGRFQVNNKICLNISGHHPETWQPSWSIRTTLLALIAFMSSPGHGSIGALDYSPEERRTLAKSSQTWACDLCGPIAPLLSKEASKPVTKDEEELVRSIHLKAEEKVESTTDESTDCPDGSAGSNPSSTTQPEQGESNNVPRPTAPTQGHGAPLDFAQSDLGDNCHLFLVLVIAVIGLLIARRLIMTIYFSDEINENHEL